MQLLLVVLNQNRRVDIGVVLKHFVKLLEEQVLLVIGWSWRAGVIRMRLLGSEQRVGSVCDVSQLFESRGRVVKLLLRSVCIVGIVGWVSFGLVFVGGRGLKVWRFFRIAILSRWTVAQVTAIATIVYCFTGLFVLY